MTKPSNPCSPPLSHSDPRAAHTIQSPSISTTIPFKRPCKGSSMNSASPPDLRQIFWSGFAPKCLIGFTISNPDESAPGGFPSAAFIEFAGFPRGNIIVTGQGATSYDARSACSHPGPGGVGLWGDYGAATVDAATGFFYLATEYIPDPTVFPRSENGNWGTFITQVAPAGRSEGPPRESEDESRH